MSSRHENRGTGWKRKERVCVNEWVAMKRAARQHGRYYGDASIISQAKNFSFTFFFYHDYSNGEALIFSNEVPGISIRLKKYAAGGGRILVYLRNSNAGVYEGVVFDGTNGNNNTQEMVPNIPHHGAVTFDAATRGLSIWVDGVKSGTVATTTDFSGALNEAWIGHHKGNPGDYAINGGINHICAFNRVLTDNEVPAIHQLGGILPSGVHAACVMHLHKADGRKWFDCVEQYNQAKGAALTNSHADLINYTDSDLTSHRVDFYTKSVLSAPAVQNGISGSITYPTGTEIISVGGYNVIAYKAHTPLTKREKLEMNSNTWPVDAPSWVRSKLSHYYLHNEVTAGEVADLIGGVNAPVAAGYTIKSISNIKLGL